MLRLPRVITAPLNGLWTGYPACCVRYYCRLVWAGVSPAEHDATSRGVDATAEWVAEGGEIGPQYVRCAGCVRRGAWVPLCRQRKGRPIWAE